jgi:transmembrane sensor
MGSWLRTQRSQFAVPQASAVASTDSIRHLPDGSLVELNGSAEIAVKFEPGFRRVELLRGEALFSVAKNSSRPFIVRAGGVEVRAVGTAFNVRLENTGVEVLVTEGTVRLENAAGGGSLLSRTPDGKPGTLGAGQKAVVEASHLGAAQVIQVAPNEVTELLSWRRTQVEFSGVELSQAVERINQTNRIQVALESAAIGRLRLTGTFFADDPETFSRLVAETFNLEAETRGDDRILLRQPDRAAPSR